MKKEIVWVCFAGEALNAAMLAADPHLSAEGEHLSKEAKYRVVSRAYAEVAARIADALLVEYEARFITKKG